MRKPAIFAYIFALMFAFVPVGTGAVSSYSLVKGTGPAVYYLLEGKRYVFPNDQIYFSWYPDFGSVVTLSDTELASYRLGGNITYRPGVRLVKIQTDPKTYAVSKGGVLRWITSEEVARALYGERWNTEVHDLSDAYFIDYRIGAPIAAPAEFDLGVESSVAGIFEDVTARAIPVSTSPTSAQSVLRTQDTVRAVKNGKWSDPRTWSTPLVPGEGSQVTIPFGIVVTYDEDVAVPMTSLTIDGRLVFETDMHTSLSAKMITVNGSMAVGTEDAPIPSSRHAEVTLTGSSPFGISDDGLIVNGYLDIHGAGRLVSWTTLSETADQGASELVLSEPVDWYVGEEVSVATGSGDAAETERHMIVDVDGAVVTLDASLTFTHRGDAYRRSEVAVLGRNVRLIGAGGGFGSRIVVGGRGELRIHGAVIEGFARTGISGHHPIYFDAAGTASESYVRNTVIDGSGNGCIVLRQTNDVSIEDVVALDSVGSCHVMTDGASDGITYRGNLVMNLTGDGASAFVIRNPSAMLTGNVAVGAPAHGYRFELPESATRSDGQLLHPREKALAGFSWNGAYANGGNGLYVGDDEGGGEYSPLTTAVFRGFEAAFNGGYGFKMHGANLVVTDAYLVGNRVGGSFSAFAADFFDSTVIGFPEYVPSDADGTLAGGEAPGRFGFIFSDGPVSVNGVTFRNFMPTDDMNAAAFSLESGNSRVPDARNNYRNISFDHAQKWFVYPPEAAGDYLAVVKDLDSHESIVSSDPFLDYACLEELGHIMTCRGVFSQLLVVFRDAGTNQPARFMRLDTGAAFTLNPGAAFDGRYAYITVPEGPGYLIEGPSTRSISIDWSGSSAPILLKIPVTAVPHARIDGGAVMVGSNPAPGEYAYDAVQGMMIIHLPAGSTADITW